MPYPPEANRRIRGLTPSQYASGLEGEIRLRDASRVRVRPIRAEDTELEQRFMQHLPELPPAMLERFTRLDYEKELALVALHPSSGEFIAVARYAPRPEGATAGKTAEFALAVADEWQRKGLGRALLERLCKAARDAGYEALYGYVLVDNLEMLGLAEKLGFRVVGRDLNELTLSVAL